MYPVSTLLKRPTAHGLHDPALLPPQPSKKLPLPQVELQLTHTLSSDLYLPIGQVIHAVASSLLFLPLGQTAPT
jgi:hypothetical protein